jgi:hypothetical protein
MLEMLEDAVMGVTGGYGTDKGLKERLWTCLYYKGEAWSQPWFNKSIQGEGKSGAFTAAPYILTLSKEQNVPYPAE